MEDRDWAGQDATDCIAAAFVLPNCWGSASLSPSSGDRRNSNFGSAEKAMGSDNQNQ